MSKKYIIAILEGDGIGPEITDEAVRVLRAIEAGCQVDFELNYAPFGGHAYFECGSCFPEETKAICDKADAILKGPIGLSHEESKKIPVEEQPERTALLPLRARYHTFANFRPVYLPAELIYFSPLRESVIQGGIDIMIIRELVGGLYFGEKEQGIDENGKRYVKETLEYNESQILQIVEVAFKEAMHRKKVLHNIHKSNVLMSSVLWNTVVEEVALSYPEVRVNHIIVDAAATALILNPRQFDVMVMENMFGDILSDLGGGLLGSLGLMPSACIGLDKSYYEPSHGSAPDIAGKGIANPYSMIGSVAMMLEKSFEMEKEAKMVWQALKTVFGKGYTTVDLGNPDGRHEIISTNGFGNKVIDEIAALQATGSYS
jgi:3-isopropylmalate dehydrogenase